MLISIDEGNRQPIYLQIVRQVKEQILIGELKAGDELPSVRDLGVALGISLHTARSAYQVLSEEGLLRIRLGKKARISANTSAVRSSELIDDLGLRLREWIVDELLQGGTPKDLHELVDQEIDSLTKRGARMREKGGT